MNDYRNISVSAIDEIYTVQKNEGKMQICNRPWYGLSFSRSGRLVYTQDKTPYVSLPGVAIFLPRGGSYQLACTQAGEFPLINFQLEEIHALPDTILALPVPEDCTWESDYEMMEQLSMRGNQKQFALKSLLYRMLDQLLAEADRTLLPPILYTALQFLEDHITDPGLSNAMIARHASISEVYLRQLFVRYLQMPPHQYLLKKRIEIAQNLLRNPNIPISSVAESSGFSGVYHFSRAFHAAEGCSPSAYRLRHSHHLL